MAAHLREKRAKVGRKKETQNKSDKKRATEGQIEIQDRIPSKRKAFRF